MKVVCGLGNPGSKYDGTRHNIGFFIVDQLCKKLQTKFEVKKRLQCSLAKTTWKEETILLIKPNTFMNNSGEAVSKTLHYYGISPSFLLVAHDEIDFVPGRVQLKFNGGSAGHRGLLSIVKALETGAFYRLRFGIGRPASQDQVHSYVLEHFSAEEKAQLSESYNKAQKEIENFLNKD
ncbi:MAG: aminoacyl-tRNA hydrolase [Deltaproteobacteria bacterium]|nr:aminoacyl-tRNA hydrolase [Deltaproteobacteria bacterium]